MVSTGPDSELDPGPDYHDYNRALNLLEAMKALSIILLTLLVLGGCSSGYDSEEECFLEETIDNLNDNEIFEKVCELKRDNNK